MTDELNLYDENEPPALYEEPLVQPEELDEDERRRLFDQEVEQLYEKWDREAVEFEDFESYLQLMQREYRATPTASLQRDIDEARRTAHLARVERERENAELHIPDEFKQQIARAVSEGRLRTVQVFQAAWANMPIGLFILCIALETVRSLMGLWYVEDAFATLITLLISLPSAIALTTIAAALSLEIARMEYENRSLSTDKFSLRIARNALWYFLGMGVNDTAWAPASATEYQTNKGYMRSLTWLLAFAGTFGTIVDAMNSFNGTDAEGNEIVPSIWESVQKVVMEGSFELYATIFINAGLSVVFIFGMHIAARWMVSTNNEVMPEKLTFFNAAAIDSTADQDVAAKKVAQEWIWQRRQSKMIKELERKYKINS